MRNPAEIARMLGWPEATRRPAPKLAVWKGAGRWRWYVDNHPSPRYSDRTNDDGHPTHAEALAVGLAALETATHRAVHSGGKLPS